MKVEKQMEIKDINGIPCIILSDDILGFKIDSHSTFNSDVGTKEFTDIQNLKEKNDRRNLLDELKKKFKEK
jgi:hypothetical protein